MGTFKRFTDGQLTATPEDIISKEDKALIEKHVLQYGGSLEESLNTPLRQGLRAYLVNLCLELVVDDKLRAEFSSMAAQFSDGWNYSRTV